MNLYGLAKIARRVRAVMPIVRVHADHQYRNTLLYVDEHCRIHSKLFEKRRFAANADRFAGNDIGNDVDSERSLLRSPFFFGRIQRGVVSRRRPDQTLQSSGYT